MTHRTARHSRPFGRTAAGAAVVAVTTLGTLALGTGPAAATQADPDRPVVAQVTISPKVVIRGDGTATGTVWVRCDPGYQVVEVSLRAVRGDTAAEGYVVPPVPCDAQPHRVSVPLTDVAGTLRPGRAALTSQVLLIDDAFGDPAGAHAARSGWFVRAHRCAH